jgi:hypothetical protein
MSISPLSRRWRHQGRLVARGDGHEHAVEGDHGLACADVALQQPVHRCRSRQIPGDLVDHGPLAAGELEREARHDVGVDRVVVLERRRLQRQAAVTTLEHHAQLKQQQLVEGETSPAPDRLVGVRRTVHHPVCLGERRQGTNLAVRRVQMIRQLNERLVQDRLDSLLDPPRRERLAGRVDRTVSFRSLLRRLFRI